MDPLMIIAVILFILWATGAFIFPVGSSLIHILLVFILIVIVIRLIQGRSAV